MVVKKDDKELEQEGQSHRGELVENPTQLVLGDGLSVAV